MKRLIKAILNRVPAHAGDRAQELVMPLRKFERLQLPEASALTITCDDGEVRDLDIVEILERHGVKGVFAVSPDLIGRPGFLGYEQLRQIRAAGHEIAFHGTTHDAFTGFRNKSRLQSVTRNGVDRLRSEGFTSTTTLIYPYGMNDRAVRQAMAPLFVCGFTTWFGINERRANRYAIRRVPFGAYTGKLPATEGWYRALIERACAGYCWPTLMLHPAASAHSSAHTEMLSRLVPFALERGLPVRTAAAHLAVAQVTVGAPTASVADRSADYK